MEWTSDQSESEPQLSQMKTSLIVNYLPQSVKEDDFRELFAMIGPLKASKLMFDHETGYSFGYGFVEYISPTDALRAIETYNGYKIKHKYLKVAFSRPNTAETKNTTLYIRNLPDEYDDDALQNLFQEHGEIVQARVIKNHTNGKSKGIAFVIMATRSEANDAISALNGHILPNSNLPLIVKLTDQNNKRINRNNRNSLNNIFNNSLSNLFADPYSANKYIKRNAANSLYNVIQSSVNSLPTQLIQNVPFQPHQYSSQPSILGNPPLPPSADNWAMIIPENNSTPTTAYPLRLQEWLQYLSANNGQISPTNIGSYLQLMSYLDHQNQYTAVDPATFAQQSIPRPYPFKDSYPDQNYFESANLYNSANLSTSNHLSVDQYSIMNNNNNNKSSNYKRTRSFNARKMVSDDPSNNDHLIYVYGLRPFATEEEVLKLFSPYGIVKRVDVVIDSKTQKAKGFAFVLMDNENEATNAVNGLNGFFHNGKNLQVRFRKQSSICT